MRCGGLDEHISNVEAEAFKKMIASVVKEFPFKVVATTLRKAKTASRNDWGAICYADGSFYEAKWRENLEIFDRVGGGDSFASGLDLRLSHRRRGRSGRWNAAPRTARWP